MLRRETHCIVCDEPIGASPWLLLNRYGIGTGTHRILAQGHNQEGEYEWHQTEDDEEEYATGYVTHWPQCSVMFIEGKMALADAAGRGSFGL